MKNNKLDIEATIEMTKIDFSNDPETLKIVTDIIQECADATGKEKSAKDFYVGLLLSSKNIFLLL